MFAGMPAFPNAVYGFHSHQQVYDKIESLAFKEKPSERKCEGLMKSVKYMNNIKSAAHVVGYIPVIGSIMAFAKIAFIMMADFKLMDGALAGLKPGLIVSYMGFSAGMKVRCLMEMSSLGFLLLIPDLILTLDRAQEKNPNEQMG